MPDAGSKQNSVSVVLEAVAEVLDYEDSHRSFLSWFRRRTSAPSTAIYQSAANDCENRLMVYTWQHLVMYGCQSIDESDGQAYISACKHDDVYT